MYATGQGVPRDFATALFWFNLAAAGGDSTAADNGRLAAAQLSPTEIAAVAKRSREWRPARPR
jgi:TPR repeat protein